MKKLPKKTEKVLRDMAQDSVSVLKERIQAAHESRDAYEQEARRLKEHACPPHEHGDGCAACVIYGDSMRKKFPTIRWETAPPIEVVKYRERDMWPIYVAWSLSTILAYWIGWAVAFGPNWAGAVRP